MRIAGMSRRSGAQRLDGHAEERGISRRDTAVTRSPSHIRNHAS
jgi:hypothetical protein